MPAPALATADEIAALVAQLQTLGTAGVASPRIQINIPGKTYNFTNATAQVFPIRKQGVTIRAVDGENAILKNLQLQIDTDSANDIVIQDIAFRSDGGFTGDNPIGPRDCIAFLSGGGTRPSPDPRSRITVQITQCSFDGYFDIAIDSNVSVAAPLLYATVDRCLFFDDEPGKPQGTIEQQGKDVRKFVNRGAINISSKAHTGVGNSLFVISNCVFIDIWRRIPRVAEGNKAIIYNNLMFRWGVGNNGNNSSNGTNEWTGVVTDNNGEAIVLKNRFIPWRKKEELADTIGIGPNTIVDVGNPRTASSKPGRTPITARADLTNEFDGPNGVPLSPQPSIGGRRVQVIDLAALYSGPALTGLTQPNPTTTSPNWMTILNGAGPPNFDRSAITATLRTVLQNVLDQRPAVPDDPPS
jgi:hypothetical protein